MQWRTGFKSEELDPGALLEELVLFLLVNNFLNWVSINKRKLLRNVPISLPSWFNHFPKAPAPNIITLGIRISKHELYRDTTFSPTAVPKSSISVWEGKREYPYKFRQRGISVSALDIVPRRVEGDYHPWKGITE